MSQASLHLIPNILAENSAYKMPQYLVDIVNHIKIFYVEEIRSARRFLKMLNKQIVIDDLEFHLLNEHHQESLSLVKGFLNSGNSIGYISEAGCPAVADPGQDLVKMAHEMNIQVIPHIGPNSILLALMASGFNGQQFYFHGYLPNKQPMLNAKIKEIEMHSRLHNCTEIFIETPYRNNQIIQEILKQCNDQTRLCVAANLTSADESIQSKSVKEWKKMNMNFHKMPAVFLLYAH